VAVVDQVFPIEQSDVERARRIVLTSQLSARDAIHLAIMQRHEIDQIMTFDRGFDGLPGVTRLAAS